jgi:Tfp pilus assembly protein PilF
VLYDRAIASAQAAIKAAPTLADAHLALGYTTYYGLLDPRRASSAYNRAHELGLGDADVLRAYALYCAYTRRPVDANGAIGQALALDPLNPGAFRAAGFVALTQRDYKRGEAQMRQALALNPQISGANLGVGTALYLQGRVAEAAKAFAAEADPVYQLLGQALVANKTGDTAQARQALGQLVARFGATSKYQQAQVLAQWGDRAAALLTLEQAKGARDAGLLLAATDALLDPLRNEPRFATLLSAMGLS